MDRRHVLLPGGPTKRVAWLLVLALTACQEARPGVEPSSRRDSAGVAIVEASPPYPTPSVSQEPLVRIGVVDGAPEYQLSNVAYAARLSDGGIVVVDGGSSQVRWYDSRGEFVSRAGGPGEGPGELLSVSAATLTPEDTLVLYDSRNRRLSWYAPYGTMSQTRRLELQPGARVMLHALRGGRLVVAEERLGLNIGPEEYNAARDSMRLLLTSSAREAVDTVMSLPGRESMTWVDYADGRPVGTRQMELPLGEVTLAGGTGNRIAVVESGGDQLALHDESGTLVGLTRRSDVDPLDASPLREEYVAHRVERAREMGFPEARAEAAAEEQLGLLPEGRAVPAFDRLLTDAAGEQIWVRDFWPEWRSNEPRAWTLHDLTGRVIGRVTTAPGLEVMHVGSGHLVGVERDDMGVEHVVAYSMN